MNWNSNIQTLFRYNHLTSHHCLPFCACKNPKPDNDNRTNQQEIKTWTPRTTSSNVHNIWSGERTSSQTTSTPIRNKNERLTLNKDTLRHCKHGSTLLHHHTLPQRTLLAGIIPFTGTLPKFRQPNNKNTTMLTSSNLKWNSVANCGWNHSFLSYGNPVICYG